MVLDLVELQHLPYITVDKGYTIVADILWGTPNLTIMFSLMKFAIAPLVAFRSGTASVPYTRENGENPVQTLMIFCKPKGRLAGVLPILLYILDSFY